VVPGVELFDGRREQQVALLGAVRRLLLEQPPALASQPLPWASSPRPSSMKPSQKALRAARRWSPALA